VQNSAAATTPFYRRFGMKATFGTILLAVCALPMAGVLRAQNPVSDGFRFVQQRQAKNIIAAAEEMPADKYGFKPTPAQMSFGDVIAHLIGDGNDYLCSAATGQKLPERPKFSGSDPKDKLLAGLKDSFQYCATALGTLKDAQLADSTPFFGGRNATRGLAALITVADWADHYSQMAIYLRLNGLLPPTAKKA
jgi:DinB family protein